MVMDEAASGTAVAIEIWIDDSLHATELSTVMM